MAQYYTPFLAQAGQAIGRGLESRGIRQQKEQQNKLAGSAYMGDPQAMEELMQVNPSLGAQVQQAATKRKETGQQQALEKRTQFKKEYEDIMGNIAKFDSFEEAKSYADTRIADIGQRYPEVMAKLGEDAVFDEGDFQLAKKLAGEGKGAFAGTSMDAQVSNMLSRGVEDPAFRETPDYARAWQLANEPKIIRTPAGDITLRPELSAVFKPPGAAKSEEEQIQASKEGVKRDVEIIPGTEKEIKTTAAEKKSFGYLSRMNAAEEHIAELGDFDSASIWEKFRGITNITASPELQQYRQAADDWIRAKLRQESGAVIAASEMAKEYEIYFPQLGDSQAVMDQKKVARAEAENSMKISSGKSFKEPEKKAAGELKEMAIPVVGAEVKGYRFIGGDPSKQESWTKI